MTDGEKHRVDLTGVPETALWTLHYRATEAARPDTVLPDPVAVELHDRLDYPFEERTGGWTTGAQWQALRSKTFDLAAREFLRTHPGATVVAIAEGLETAFWRVDDGSLTWVGLDLPESAATRALLPAHERRRTIEADALDDSWHGRIDAANGVLFLVQGLLMYLKREQVHGLITGLARDFPGATMVFDAVPHWMSRANLALQKQTPPEGRMRPPGWWWYLDRTELSALRNLPGVDDVRRLPPPPGRGVVHRCAMPLVAGTPIARHQVLSVWRATFAS